MDIRQIVYFSTIYEEKSITSAGDKLHISQPTLSNQLKVLEDELGVVLFERKSRKLIPTKEADILYTHAKVLESNYDSIIKIFRDLKDGINETLNIGCICSLVILEFPNIISEYRSHNPGCKLQVFENNTSNLLSLLDEGHIDLCIAKGSVDSSLYHTIPLDSFLNTENDCLAAVGLRERFGSPEETIPFIMLDKEPLIVQRTHEASIMQAFGIHDITPNITSLHENVISAMSWSAHNMGISIMPYSSTKLINFVPGGENLVVKKLTNPTISTCTNLIWRKDLTISLSSEHFISFIREKIYS